MFEVIEFIRQYADYILSAGGAFFTVLLLPTIADQHRRRSSTIPMSTSVFTALTLYMFVVIYASFGLWLTTAVETVQASSYLVVAWQRWRYGAP